MLSQHETSMLQVKGSFVVRGYSYFQRKYRVGCSVLTLRTHADLDRVVITDTLIASSELVEAVNPFMH